MQELKPCPFCGAEARLFTGNTTCITCSNDQCVIYTDVPLPFNDHGHLDSAVAACNRRVPDGVPVTPAARLTDEQIDKLQEESDCFVGECCDVRIHEFARAVEAFVLSGNDGVPDTLKEPRNG
jgi:hypothetical protein